MEDKGTERVGSFRDLLVWQQAMELAGECYRLTRDFPREELYGMTSQIRRASVSVPSNVAEGSGRGTKRDYVGFLRIALGSLAELETLLLLAPQLGVTTPERTEPLLAQAASVNRLLRRLITALAADPPAR